MFGLGKIKGIRLFRNAVITVVLLSISLLVTGNLLETVMYKWI